MELRHLRYFVTVAEELNFRRAARRLCIEQSPLSRQIRMLEKGLGVRLLERTARGTTLTWAGERFLRDARRVLSSMEELQRLASDLAAGEHGRVRIGVTEDVAPAALGRFLEVCRVEAASIDLSVTEVAEGQQIAALETGDIDVALLTFRPDENFPVKHTAQK